MIKCLFFKECGKRLRRNELEVRLQQPEKRIHLA